MLTVVVSIIIAAIAAVGILICLMYAYRIWAIMSVRVEPVAVNDDTIALNQFLSLLNMASESIIIYDDGNSMDGSLYENSQAVNAIKERIDGSDLTVKCFFNCPNDTLFVRELSQYDNVDIKFRDGDRPNDIHFKIIDGGKSAYLSWHEFGSSERRFKMLDCRHLPPMARRSVLGEYIQGFERNFTGPTSRPTGGS